MARIGVGMVFLADYNEADNIINEIQKQFNIEVLHVQSSYQKLWITKTQPQEVDHHD